MDGYTILNLPADLLPLHEIIQVRTGFIESRAALEERKSLPAVLRVFPGDMTRDVIGRLLISCQHKEHRLQTAQMVFLKLIDARSKVRNGLAVSWEHKACREIAHNLQRAQIIAEWVTVRLITVPDMRAAVLKDMITGDQHRKLWVVETDESGGVPRRPDHLEAERAPIQPLASLKHHVRPEGWHGYAHARRLIDDSLQFVRGHAATVQPCKPGGAGAVQRLLTASEITGIKMVHQQAGARFSHQAFSQPNVIRVDMRQNDLSDVVDLRAELLQLIHEHRIGLRCIPRAIDEPDAC